MTGDTGDGQQDSSKKTSKWIVPIIDLSPLFLPTLADELSSELGNREEKKCYRKRHTKAVVELAKQWDAALRSVGFCQIVGVEVAVKKETVERAERAARRFFSLEKEYKAEAAASFYGDLGYCKPGMERVSQTHNEAPDRPTDDVESYVYHHKSQDRLPRNDDDFRDAMDAYWIGMETLTRALMRLSAISLNLDEDFFEEAYKHHSSVLRLAHYPPIKSLHDNANNRRLRYGEHTDYIGFTILWQDSSPRPGLEVRMPDNGTWQDVPPVPERLSFTINVADLISQWTNDRWLSNLHRVANTTKISEEGRLSIVFFSGPNSNWIVECVPGQGKKKYPPVRAGDYLKMKLEASNQL